MKRLFKRMLWNIVIGIAHMIPAQTYKGEALKYLRYRRDLPKRPEGPKAIPTHPLRKFIDPGTGRRLGRKP